MSTNEFYFSDSAEATHNTPHPHAKTAPGWNLRMIFATEPALSSIAVEVAAKRWFWKRARIAAFKTAMSKADKLIGEDATDPRLRDKAARDFFNDYIFELLRL